MQSSFRAWMLPEGVVEALPTDAEKLIFLEQAAFALFSGWGYLPLRPPLMEYADTFLGDSNSTLSAQTIQFKDQKSGRQLGFRSDITPQIARIDGHYLKTERVSRYAYSGEVARSFPAGQGSLRNPTVVGAELLGSSSEQADVEIVSLLVAYLSKICLSDYIIELGNVDIVANLLADLSVAAAQYPLFYEAFSRKDREQLLKRCRENGINDQAAQQLVSLVDIYGDESVIVKALEQFAEQPSVVRGLQGLLSVAKQLKILHPEIILSFDVSDVRGYGYHNGLIFSAYTSGVWQAVARGGRYDAFGNDFSDVSQLRPSIGFSCDLNLLLPKISVPKPAKQRIIACAATLYAQGGQTLKDYVTQLREQGEVVIHQFDDNASHEMCTHRIEADDNVGTTWVVTKIN